MEQEKKKYKIKILDKEKETDLISVNDKKKSLIEGMEKIDTDLSKIFETLKNLNDNDLTSSIQELAESLVDIQVNMINLDLDNIIKDIKNENVLKYKIDVKKIIDVMKGKINIINDYFNHHKESLDSIQTINLNELKQKIEFLKSKDGEVDIKETLRNMTDLLKEDVIKADLVPINIIDPKELQSSFFELILKQIIDSGKKMNVEIYTSYDDFIIKLKRFYNIYNSDIMLKLMTIINYPDKWKQINDPQTNLEKYLFIDLNKQTNFVFDETNEIFKKMNKSFSRDNDIYIKISNSNSNSNKSYICSFNLMNYIFDNYKKNNVFGFGNRSEAEQMAEILFKLHNYIFELLNNYKKIMERNNYIDKIFNQILAENKKVFTFLKIRKDDNREINPIYKPQIYDNYLFMAYDNKSSPDLKSLVRKTSEKNINMQELANKVIDNNKSNEYYYYGKYDDIFVNNSNKDISESEKIKSLLDRFVDLNKPLCIIGYGQSGVGKTSTLIYDSHMENGRPIINRGIIMELCCDQKIVENFKEIKLKIKNLYVYYDDGLTQLSNIREEHIFSSDLTLIEDLTEIVFSYDKTNRDWYYKNTEISIGQLIKDCFQRRQIEPTPNNPESSRSHMIINLELIGKNNKNNNIIICDLAGVENEFDCEDVQTILKFDTQYAYKSKYKYYDYIKEKPLRDNEIKEFTFGEELFKEQKKTNNLSNVELLNRLNAPKLNQIIIKYNNYIKNLIDNKKIEYQQEGGFNEFPQIENLDNFDNKSCKDNKVILSDYIKNNFEKDFNEKFTEEIQKYNDYIDINDFFTTKVNVTDYLNFLIIKKKNLTMNLTKKDNDTIIDKIANISIILADRPQNFKGFMNINKLNTFSLNIDNLHIEMFKNVFSQTETEISNKSLKLSVYEYIINDMKEKIKKQKEQIYNYMCQYIRYKKIEFNCNIRRMEGYLINQSLFDLKLKIQEILLNFIKIDDNLPIVYHNYIVPYLKNSYIEYNNYEYFTQDITRKRTKDSTIIKTIGQFIGENRIKDLNFMVFNIINISDNVNNPPIPPYININKAKYYNYLKNKYEGVDFVNQIQEEFKNIINGIRINITKYSHYKNINFDKISDEMLLEIIENNNATTLLGSIDTLDLLNNPFNNIFGVGYLKFDVGYSKDKFNLSDLLKGTIDIPNILTYNLQNVEGINNILSNLELKNYKYDLNSNMTIKKKYKLKYFF